MTEQDFARLKGSKTEKNLLSAFAGESQAHAKYLYYASVARKEGRTDFQTIFEETAGNELEHAELWFKYLHCGSVPTTSTNIEDAKSGENYEQSKMYPKFAKVADEEGFSEIAAKFRLVAKIEANHEKRYENMLNELNANEAVIKENVLVVWKCEVCGHIHVGPKALPVCPVCGHKNSFRPYAVNYTSAE